MDIIIFPKGYFFIGAPCWFEGIAPDYGKVLDALPLKLNAF